jgi:hypothetical protein
VIAVIDEFGCGCIEGFGLVKRAASLPVMRRGVK